jgi:hypothetical protein
MKERLLEHDTSKTAIWRIIFGLIILVGNFMQSHLSLSTHTILLILSIGAIGSGIADFLPRQWKLAIVVLKICSIACIIIVVLVTIAFWVAL